MGKKFERVTTPKTVNWFVTKRVESPETIRFDLKIQRNEVWTDDQKSLLIHSLMVGFPVPVIFSCDMDDGNYWILDGQQRLKAVTDYVMGEYKLVEGTPDVDGYEVEGKYFSELDEAYQNELKKVSIAVFHYKNLTQVERDEMFYRLNNGTSLSKTEVTRSLLGDQLDNVQRLSNHDFMGNKVQLGTVARNRFKDEELALQTLMLFENRETLKNLGLNEVQEYAKKKAKEGFTDNQIYDVMYAMKRLGMASEEFLKKELKMFKKTNVPVMLYVMNQYEADIKGREEELGEWLKEFFIENVSELYAETARSASTKKEHVDRRIQLFEAFIAQKLMKN